MPELGEIRGGKYFKEYKKLIYVTSRTTGANRWIPIDNWREYGDSKYSISPEFEDKVKEIVDDARNNALRENILQMINDRLNGKVIGEIFDRQAIYDDAQNYLLSLSNYQLTQFANEHKELLEYFFAGTSGSHTKGEEYSIQTKIQLLLKRMNIDITKDKYLVKTDFDREQFKQDVKNLDAFYTIINKDYK